MKVIGQEEYGRVCMRCTLRYVVAVAAVVVVIVGWLVVYWVSKLVKV